MKQTSGLLLVVMRSNVSLKSCLRNLISSNQTAFVTGRNKSERLPTHGIVKHYQRNKGKARCASKVDFKKAYDSKEWTTSKGAIPQIKEGSLLVRYLGMPLIPGKPSMKDCKPLTDKITARINSQSNTKLSFAGRLQLLQSVVYSIQK